MEERGEATVRPRRPLVESLAPVGIKLQFGLHGTGGIAFRVVRRQDGLEEDRLLDELLQRLRPHEPAEVHRPAVELPKPEDPVEGRHGVLSRLGALRQLSVEVHRLLQVAFEDVEPTVRRTRHHLLRDGHAVLQLGAADQNPRGEFRQFAAGDEVAVVPPCVHVGAAHRQPLDEHVLRQSVRHHEGFPSARHHIGHQMGDEPLDVPDDHDAPYAATSSETSSGQF